MGAGEPALSAAEAHAAVSKKTAPRVTKEAMQAKVAAVRYVVDGTLTVCVLELRNGFKVVGASAAASPENFDRAVGERYAYDDAFGKLWPLEGYLLRSRLSGEEE